MSHITSIGAGIFSDLSVYMPTTAITPAQIATYIDAATFQALFVTEIANVGGTKAAGTFVRVKNVREFPAFGTPPNIVNVPTYGQATSQQIQGQSDAPTMELTLNCVPADWAREAGVLLGNAVGDGNQYVFRFTLLNALPTGSGVTQYASSAAGIGTRPNSQWYWIGKIDAFQLTPQLTDANQCTISLTLQSSMFGAYTI